MYTLKKRDYIVLWHYTLKLDARVELLVVLSEPSWLSEVVCTLVVVCTFAVVCTLVVVSTLVIM